MTEWEVGVADWSDVAELERRVEAACAAEGLHSTLKGTLAAYAGSIHWHWKRGRERGVLEVTIWPGGRQVRISVQAGRTAPWTHMAAERVRDQIADV